MPLMTHPNDRAVLTVPADQVHAMEAIGWTVQGRAEDEKPATAPKPKRGRKPVPKPGE